MAKQAKSSSQVDSEYDISKYIDLDDPVFEEEDDSEYTTIPHRESEILTPGLDGDLEGALENYIKAGKVSWSDKRNLRRLAAENRELEDAIREVDPELFARTKAYHGIVVAILKEKDDLGKASLDDSDPYDSEVTSPLEVSEDAKNSKRESNEIFAEIERLESHRTELNGKRTAALEEIRETVARGENEASEAVDKLLDSKIAGIAGLSDITKSKVSLEDEEEFERGVGELTEYMENGFDPLAYDDEDGDFVAPKAKEDDRVYSVEELLAIDERTASRRPAAPAKAAPAGPSFGELFGVTPKANSATGTAAEEERSSAPNFFDMFSSSESPSELDDALGEENLSPDTSSPADEDSFELEEPGAEPVLLPTEPISVSELAELASEDHSEVVADNLSDSERSIDGHDGSQETLAESAFWSTPEDLIEDTVPLDANYYEDTADGSEIDSQSEEVFDAEAAGFIIDEDNLGRAVIFEELKAKYSISFEGIPGLED